MSILFFHITAEKDICLTMMSNVKLLVPCSRATTSHDHHCKSLADKRKAKEEEDDEYKEENKNRQQ